MLIKFNSTLDSWKRHNLSLTGRIVVLNTFAIPQLTYLASALPARLRSSPKYIRQPGTSSGRERKPSELGDLFPGFFDLHLLFL